GVGEVGEALHHVGECESHCEHNHEVDVHQGVYVQIQFQALLKESLLSSSEELFHIIEALSSK
ncbi:MAG: hypothetical protein ACTSR3_23775, partial [Candidatus Helarchaeota archaeon]